MRFREVTVEDVASLELARLPDTDAGPADPRMALNLRGEHHPVQALAPRVMYLAEDSGRVLGYIGGHLTERFGCDGELQYLYVSPESRRSGVASGLLDLLARWFRTQGAARICVDVEPANARARAFYFSRGATELDSHWLVWDDIGKRIAR